MNAPSPCLQCQIPGNPEPSQPEARPVCNPLLCPKTLIAPPPQRRIPRRRIPPIRSPRSQIPQTTLEIETGEDEELTTNGAYRPVSNRAGKTIIARPGTRNCDPRCRNAKGAVCVCSCNGRNHGAG